MSSAPAATESLPAGLRTVDQALHRTRFRALPFLGPAFIACVAYIDPGNFATNIAGGAKFGYLLVWVIVAANLMAMLLGVSVFLGKVIALIFFQMLIRWSMPRRWKPQNRRDRAQSRAPHPIPRGSGYSSCSVSAEREPR